MNLIPTMEVGNNVEWRSLNHVFRYDAILARRGFYAMEHKDTVP